MASWEASSSTARFTSSSFCPRYELSCSSAALFTEGMPCSASLTSPSFASSALRFSAENCFTSASPSAPSSRSFASLSSSRFCTMRFFSRY